MRISTPQMFQQRISAMLDQQVKLSRTEQQIATGKRLLSAADDPAGALRTLQLSDRMAQSEQFQKNIDAATSRLSLEESTLEDAGNTLQRVRELAVQAVNEPLSLTDHQALAVEVRVHLDGLLQAANTKDVNGEYLFAGYQGNTQPFSHDGMGNFTYNGDQGQRHLQVGPTRQVAVGDHGAKVFLGVPASAGGATSPFEVVYEFAAALDSGAPLSDTITDLDAALEQMLNTRAEVGARMRAAEEQHDTNASLKLLLEQDRASITELDYAEAISRFNQQLLAFQASQQAFAKVQGLSLFNFLR